MTSISAGSRPRPPTASEPPRNATGARFAAIPRRAGERGSSSRSPFRMRLPSAGPPIASRQPREAPVAETELLVATFNIRNIADRWPERIPLLLADMAALQPDLIG